MMMMMMIMIIMMIIIFIIDWMMKPNIPGPLSGLTCLEKYWNSHWNTEKTNRIISDFQDFQDFQDFHVQDLAGPLLLSLLALIN